MFIALLVGYGIFAGYSAVARDRMPLLEFRAGSWFPLWVAGLALISYFGDVDRAGVPPTLVELYDDPQFRREYPA